MANNKKRNRKRNFKNFRNSYWNSNRRSETAQQVDLQIRKYQRDDVYMGLEGIDLIQKTESILLTDLFANIFTSNMLHDPTIKSESKGVLREILKKYEKYNIFCSRGVRFIPEKSVRLVSSDVYLTKDRLGMPLGKFLLYLKGADFVDEPDRLATLAEWTGGTADEIHEIYQTILLFFLTEAVKMNKEKKEEWGIFQPADILGTPAPIIIGSINNYNYYM